MQKPVSSSVIDILSVSLLLRKLVYLEVVSLYSHFVTPSFHVLRVAVEAPVSRVCLCDVLHQVPFHVEHIRSHRVVAKGRRKVQPPRDAK